MKQHLHHHPRVFSIDTAVTLALRRAGWVRSLGGRVWLTRSRGSADLIIAPGAWQWVQPGAQWVIEPWDAHRPGDNPMLEIEWQPLPSRWASVRHAWRSFVERLRGDAAFDDPCRPAWAARPCDGVVGSR